MQAKAQEISCVSYIAVGGDSETQGGKNLVDPLCSLLEIIDPPCSLPEKIKIKRERIRREEEEPTVVAV